MSKKHIIQNSLGEPIRNVTIHMGYLCYTMIYVCASVYLCACGSISDSTEKSKQSSSLEYNVI